MNAMVSGNLDKPIAYAVMAVAVLWLVIDIAIEWRGKR